MADKQNIKIMLDSIMARKGFEVPPMTDPMTDIEKKELKERTLWAIEHLR